MDISSFALCAGEMCFCVLCAGETPIAITSVLALAANHSLACLISVETEQVEFSQMDHISRTRRSTTSNFSQNGNLAE
jgi:hypothetical protein